MENLRESPIENHQGMVGGLAVQKISPLGQTHSMKYNLMENVPQKLFINRT